MSNLNGLLKVFGMCLVQKKKINIGEGGDYYYTLGFSNSVDMLIITAGKKADEMVFSQTYDLGLDYINNKLKLVDFVETSGKGGKN